MVYYYGIVTLPFLEDSFRTPVEGVVTVVYLRIYQPILVLSFPNMAKFIVVCLVLTVLR